MAKGNLFLGTAARSVGDVVMYRREGTQVSRVRVRKIANPRTNAQSTQRSAFSPVAKFFSPLAIVLERAWEGKNKSQSYSAFLKENIKLAKKNGWLLPKGTGFFPLPYQLTNGSLRPVLFEKDTEKCCVTINEVATSGVDYTTVAGVSSAFVAKGYKDGDVITFIGVRKDTNGNFSVTSAQMLIDTTSADTMAATYPRIYVDDQSQSQGYINIGFNFTDGVATAMLYARKENDIWRRSKEFLLVEYNIIAEISDAAYKAAAIASYGNSAGGDNPLVYLDGDELQD